MKKLGAFGIAAAIVVLPHFAFAQPEQNNVQPVRLSYAADSDCPSKDDFVQAIRDRGFSIRESAEAARAMSVTLVRDSQSGQWNGQLRVHDANGDASRDVSAGTCADAARSIAIFASLALTPDAEAPAPTPPISRPTPIPPPNPAKIEPIHAIAPPPKIASPSLARHRYSIGAETIFHLSSQAFENLAGIGVVGAYHVSDRVALGLSADLLHSFDDYPISAVMLSGATEPATSQPSSNIALLRVMARAPISLHVAHGAVDGPSGSPIDVFVTPQIGTILTKPNNLPSQVPETYSPSFAFELDLGARALLTTSFAIDASVGFLFYEERYAQASYLTDALGDLRSTTYHWEYYANFGPLFQLGAEFDFPSVPVTR